MESNRRKFLKSLAGLSGLAASAAPDFVLASSKSTAQVKDIRLSKNKGYVRLVFDLDKNASHSIFTLHGPERVVLDIKKAKMSHGLVDQVQANSLIGSIRSGVRNDNDLRVVFDLSKEVTPRSFLLAPSGKSGYRLVLDLHDKNKSSRVKKALINNVA
ncbi:MAG: AMIN domain-containing protein [Gammaproteobacteria bacterium]|nr:AMIN domain-containing protein [Gammaproteobacteria bacterium]